LQRALHVLDRKQEFFASKGFTNKPNRCVDCRAARKAQRGAGGGAVRATARAAAADMAAAAAIVPARNVRSQVQPMRRQGFRSVPTRGDKPVYCRDCFQSRGGGGGGGSYR